MFLILEISLIRLIQDANVMYSVEMYVYELNQSVYLVNGYKFIFFSTLRTQTPNKYSF